MTANKPNPSGGVHFFNLDFLLSVIVEIGFFLVCLLPAIAHAGEVPAKKLDCSVYESKTRDMPAGLKVGSFFFKVGPDVTFSHRSGVAWNKVVQGTIARFIELCSQYNAGIVTKAEYVVRRKEIEALYQEAQEMEGKLFEATRQRAKAAGDELDEILGRKPQRPQTNVRLEIAVEDLARRIDKGDTITLPLEPSTPCPVEDILGALGEKEC
ncbi:hypothetical protein [Nitrospira sp. Ecomares 2.1]